jgi:hypothetical protein
MQSKHSDEEMEWEDWGVILVVLFFICAVGLFVITGGQF